MAWGKKAILLCFFISAVSARLFSQDPSGIPVELPEEEFDFHHADPAYQFSTQGLLDLDALLQNPQLEAAFIELSDDAKENLIKALELFNESFREALTEVAQEIKENKN